MTMMNTQVLLAARPTGEPSPENFDIVQSAIPEAGEGEIVVRTIYLSIDPYMRGRMDDAKSYAASVQIGDVMTGGVVGQVMQSRNPKFSEGDFVLGMFGWQALRSATVPWFGSWIRRLRRFRPLWAFWACRD